MSENDTNDRLGAALKMAKKMGSSRKKRTYYFSDPKNAKAANDKYLAMRGPRLATSTMRIQTDAIALAQSAWTEAKERIEVTSDLIRVAAKEKLGMS